MGKRQPPRRTPRPGVSQQDGDAKPRRSPASGKKDKKRGRKGSAARANKFRRGTGRTEAREEGVRGLGGTNRNNTNLSYEDTVDIMNRRKKGTEEISAKDLEDLMANKEEDVQKEAENGEDQKHRASVAATKVPIYGTLRLDVKPDDAIRFFSGNVNGLSFWLSRNYKAERLKYVFEQHGIDTMGLQEVCINWKAFKASQTLASLLRSGHESMRSTASHNKRDEEIKNIGRKQRGGTAVIMKERLAAFVVDSGVDHTDLGRWSWYLLEGSPGHRTRVISAYAPCGNAACDTSTVYQQHMRYIWEKGLKTNPKKMFADDLLAVIRRWRKAGDRVILMMDANENVLDGNMCKQFKEDDIRMVEAVHSQEPGHGPKTFFRGQQSIDGIWVSTDLEIISASYLPFNADIGDHRPVVADLTMRSVLGDHINKIVPVKARRLNSKIKNAGTNTSRS